MIFSASLSHRHYCRTGTIMKDLDSAGCAAYCIITSVTCLLKLQCITSVLLGDPPPWGNTLHSNPILQLFNKMWFCKISCQRYSELLMDRGGFAILDFLKYLIILKLSDLCGRSYGVTDMMDQHQDVWNMVCVYHQMTQ